jgi:hypothetical protein
MTKDAAQRRSWTFYEAVNFRQALLVIPFFFTVDAAAVLLAIESLPF